MLSIKDEIIKEKNAIACLLVSCVLLTLMFLFFILMARKYDVTMSYYTRDPAAIFKGSPFAGIISNIGIILWCATASICFFSLVLNSKKGIFISAFLLMSGIFTSILMFDDLFMIHEYIIPEKLNVSQKAVYVFYILFAAMYFSAFFKIIIKFDFLLIIVSCSFFFLSLVCDNFLNQQGMIIFTEESSKLFGIATWFLFFSRTCLALGKNDVIS
jgi:hypothetical protein